MRAVGVISGPRYNYNPGFFSTIGSVSVYPCPSQQGAINLPKPTSDLFVLDSISRVQKDCLLV